MKQFFKPICTATAAIMYFTPATTLAQTPQSAQTGQQAPINLNAGKMTVQLPQAVVFQGGNPVQVKGQVVGVENAPSGVSFSGVSVEGYARQVAVAGKTVAQVVWNQVGKSSSGDARSTVLDQSWSSQLVVDGGTIAAGKNMTAGGNMAVMVKAVQGLKSAAASVASGAAAAAGSALGNDNADEKNETSGSSAAESGKNSPAQGNDIASKFQRLAVSEKAKEAVAEILEGTRITSEGCSVRIDEAQGVAIVQSKAITVKGGVDSGESECTDSEVRYELKRSISRCADRVDLAALKAKPQYITYYTDAGGSTTDVGECKVDTDKEFVIVEDKTGCSLETNFSTMRATERAELIYEDALNRRVVVRGCEPTANGDVAMVEKTNDCSLRHDFNAGVSLQMAKVTFNLNSQEYTARECTDTGTSYAHETVSAVNGAPVCDWLVSTENGFAYPQARKRIEVDGNPQWVTECTPDAGSKSPLVKTVVGCESDFVHNLSTNQSFGKERTYYETSGGARSYITGCLQSEVSYPHQVEGGDIHGYEHHDDQLYSFAKTKIYITGTQVGKVEVSPAQVREGAAQVPFVYNKAKIANTGDVTYEGCNSMAARQNVEVYARPDGSVFSKVTGPAAPGDPVYACIASIATTWNKVGETRTRNARDWSTGHQRYWSTATYEGTRTLTRGDGQQISETAGRGSHPDCASVMPCSGWSCVVGRPSNICSATTDDASLINSWRIGLGW